MGRGFQSHKGYFQGEINYYMHNMSVNLEIVKLDGLGVYRIRLDLLQFSVFLTLDWWTMNVSSKNETGIHTKTLLDKVLLC